MILNVMLFSHMLNEFFLRIIHQNKFSEFASYEFRSEDNASTYIRVSLKSSKILYIAIFNAFIKLLTESIKLK